VKAARVAVSALALSAAAFIGLVSHEGYVEDAMVPTKNDRPTAGFGSTFHADGTPVKMGDKLPPVRALITAKAHIDREEASFRKSLDGAHLHQAEFDIYMDWVYQYGTGAWRTSSMRTHILKGEYPQACESLLKWRRQGGRDCSLPENWGPQGCRGVWTRQLERHEKCLAAQNL
jgi:GH24 family phage-related lysozyme (muramidase)